MAGAPVSAPAPAAAAGVNVAAGEANAAVAIAPDRVPADVAFPLRFDHKVACAAGFGIAVHLARRLVIVAGYVDKKLHCYHLDDGAECGVIGRGSGKGNMQFKWADAGGLCVTQARN